MSDAIEFDSISTGLLSRHESPVREEPVKSATEPPIPTYVDHRALLQELIDAGASDLHAKAGSPAVHRVAGQLQRGEGPELEATDVARLAQALLDENAQQALLEDGSVVTAHSEPGVGRFRVSAFRQRGAISVVVHTVAHDIAPLDELGLPEVAATLAGLDSGLVVVASPVGNGLSTTLASLVDHVNRTRASHLLTVESPIEFLHRDDMGFVSQLEVGVDVATVAEGVHAASRVDADVVVVSDLAERRTLDAAIDVVARGRLVIGGVGASNAAGAIEVLLELYSVQERPVARAALARSIAGVLAQQLLPSSSGASVLAVESLVATAKVRDTLADGERSADLRHLMEEGSYHGMQTMDQALTHLANSSVISHEVALAAAVDAEELRIALVR